MAQERYLEAIHLPMVGTVLVDHLGLQAARLPLVFMVEGQEVGTLDTNGPHTKIQMEQ